MSDKPDEAWLERVREAYRATPAPGPEAKERLQNTLRSEPAPRRATGGLRWWVERRSFTARPWAIAAALAALVGGGAWLGRLSSHGISERQGTSQGAVSGSVASDSTTVVRFALSAPGAASVSLVGDFNGWDAAATPMREADPGVWSVSLPVSPGRHVYAFVVDRSRWVNDPVAPLAPEDGFGVPNSVIVVGWPGGV